jgi:hypothetical protein
MNTTQVFHDHHGVGSSIDSRGRPSANAPPGLVHAASATRNEPAIAAMHRHYINAMNADHLEQPHAHTEQGYPPLAYGVMPMPGMAWSGDPHTLLLQGMHRPAHFVAAAGHQAGMSGPLPPGFVLQPVPGMLPAQGHSGMSAQAMNVLGGGAAAAATPAALGASPIGTMRAVIDPSTGLPSFAMYYHPSPSAAGPGAQQGPLQPAPAPAAQAFQMTVTSSAPAQLGYPPVAYPTAYPQPLTAPAQASMQAVDMYGNLISFTMPQHVVSGPRPHAQYMPPPAPTQMPGTLISVSMHHNPGLGRPSSLTRKGPAPSHASRPRPPLIAPPTTSTAVNPQDSTLSGAGTRAARARPEHAPHSQGNSKHSVAESPALPHPSTVFGQPPALSAASANVPISNIGQSLGQRRHLSAFRQSRAQRSPPSDRIRTPAPPLTTDRTDLPPRPLAEHQPTSQQHIEQQRENEARPEEANRSARSEERVQPSPSLSTTDPPSRMHASTNQETYQPAAEEHPADKRAQESNTGLLLKPTAAPSSSAGHRPSVSLASNTSIQSLSVIPGPPTPPARVFVYPFMQVTAAEHHQPVAAFNADSAGISGVPGAMYMVADPASSSLARMPELVPMPTAAPLPPSSMFPAGLLNVSAMAAHNLTHGQYIPSMPPGAVLALPGGGMFVHLPAAGAAPALVTDSMALSQTASHPTTTTVSAQAANAANKAPQRRHAAQSTEQPDGDHHEDSDSTQLLDEHGAALGAPAHPSRRSPRRHRNPEPAGTDRRGSDAMSLSHSQTQMQSQGTTPSQLDAGGPGTIQPGHRGSTDWRPVDKQFRFHDWSNAEGQSRRVQQVSAADYLAPITFAAAAAAGSDASSSQATLSRKPPAATVASAMLQALAQSVANNSASQDQTRWLPDSTHTAPQAPSVTSMTSSPAVAARSLPLASKSAFTAASSADATRPNTLPSVVSRLAAGPASEAPLAAASIPEQAQTESVAAGPVSSATAILRACRCGATDHRRTNYHLCPLNFEKSFSGLRATSQSLPPSDREAAARAVPASVLLQRLSAGLPHALPASGSQSASGKSSASNELDERCTAKRGRHGSQESISEDENSTREANTQASNVCDVQGAHVALSSAERDANARPARFSITTASDTASVDRVPTSSAVEQRLSAPHEPDRDSLAITPGGEQDEEELRVPSPQSTAAVPALHRKRGGGSS